MSAIGILTASNRPNPANSEYEGNIRTLELNLEIRLIPKEDKRSDRAPDFVVEDKGKVGQWVNIGSAWWKETTQKDGSIARFISISIEDPSMSETLHCTAFLDSSGNEWVITWRPRKPPVRNTTGPSQPSAVELREVPKASLISRLSDIGIKITMAIRSFAY
jgi:uncharacterized protein (DUF736 family)